MEFLSGCFSYGVSETLDFIAIGDEWRRIGRSVMEGVLATSQDFPKKVNSHTAV